MVRQIFDEIIKQNEFTPEAWKKVKIQVLHKKKSDVENVRNDRPICSLPALYKLFSKILYRRLYSRLDQEQAEDQAGFRSSYQTTDHFSTYRMIEQKCHEWCIKMWIATIDFTKAFDSITHQSIWTTLLLRYQPRVQQTTEENLRRPENISTDQCREQHVRDQERNHTGVTLCLACFSTQFYRIH